jgi:hypothetical protein
MPGGSFLAFTRGGTSLGSFPGGGSSSDGRTFRVSASAPAVVFPQMLRSRSRLPWCGVSLG